MSTAFITNRLQKGALCVVASLAISTGCGGGGDDLSGASTGTTVASSSTSTSVASSGAGGAGGIGGAGGQGGIGGSGGAADDYKLKPLLGTCDRVWQIGGKAKDDRYPWGFVTVNDVNGDGIRDIVVLATAGALELRSGADGATLKTVQIEDAMFLGPLGGDLDGDGAPDVRVHSRKCDNGGAGGTAMLGSCTDTLRAISGKDLSTLFQLDGPAGDADFATSASWVADEDKDSKPDLAVGSQSDDINQAGRVDIVSAQTKSVIRTVQPAGVTSWFGSPVLGGVDLDGDGKGDLVIGDPETSLFDGRILAVSSTGSILWSVDGEPAGPDLLGDTLYWAGDLDGDGVPDVLSGVHNHPVNGSGNVGRVLALSGRTGAVLWKTDGLREEMALGLALEPIGDIDGDSIPDLLVGGPKPAIPDPIADGQGGFFEILSGKDGKALVQIEEDIPANSMDAQGHLIFGYDLGSAVGLLAPATKSQGVEIVVSAPKASFAGVEEAGRIIAFRCTQ